MNINRGNCLGGISVRVLFLEMDDAARSQIAAGLLRHLGGDTYDVYSAGPLPAPSVSSEAVEVMREIGLDISTQRPTSSYEYLGRGFDYVFAVCDGAAEPCPVFPGSTTCWPITNPAAIEGGKEERLSAFRAARDRIQQLVHETFGLAHASESSR